MKAAAANFILFCIILISIQESFCKIYQEELNKKFEFANYPYKKSSHLENKYHSRFNKCNMQTECANFELSARQNCVLKCISAKCYQIIYAPNPLEDGEIDQRLHSFKGCYSEEN